MLSFWGWQLDGIQVNQQLGIQFCRSVHKRTLPRCWWGKHFVAPDQFACLDQCEGGGGDLRVYPLMTAGRRDSLKEAEVRVGMIWV